MPEAVGTIVRPHFRWHCSTLLVIAYTPATYPNTRMSPALTTPIHFRTSGIDACDHSECFLFSYDLHRLYPTPERPPKIIMNPDVRTAYADNWWKWHNGVTRIPVIQWWLCESLSSLSKC